MFLRHDPPLRAPLNFYYDRHPFGLKRQEPEA